MTSDLNDTDIDIAKEVFRKFHNKVASMIEIKYPNSSVVVHSKITCDVLVIIANLISIGYLTIPKDTQEFDMENMVKSILGYSL